MLLMVQLQTQMIIVAAAMIIFGFILVALGMIQKFKDNEETGASNQRTSKGIMFIGPIPIVWGFSRRTQIILFVVAISLVLVWIFWIL